MSYKKLALKVLLSSFVITSLVFLLTTKISLAISLVVFNIAFESGHLYLKNKNKLYNKVIEDEELYDIYGGD
tara:strand:+ start:6046 stop:6261 length:216 start_codon:yes stop_codon:yes gene_type:complete